MYLPLRPSIAQKWQKYHGYLSRFLFRTSQKWDALSNLEIGVAIVPFPLETYAVREVKYRISGGIYSIPAFCKVSDFLSIYSMAFGG